MSKLDDRLDVIAERSFIVNCHGEYDKDATKSDKDYYNAKLAILSDLLEIIGEDKEQPRPLDEESRARFYRVGGQNFIKNQLRDKVKEYCK